MEAARDLRKWEFKGVTSNKALCSWDLRTDNMIWRKVHPKLDEYECVIIDHQIWMWGASPGYDLCTYSYAAQYAPSSPFPSFSLRSLLLSVPPPSCAHALSALSCRTLLRPGGTLSTYKDFPRWLDLLEVLPILIPTPLL